MRELSVIEEKVLEIIFKDKVVTDILVDALLPEVFWSSEAVDDYKPHTVYQIARENLKGNLNKLLEKS